MRTRWSIIHSDEVYFRDTAHGFLAWAVGLVITAAFLTSAAISMVGDVVQSSTSTVSSAPASADNGYFRDMLLRSDHFGVSRVDVFLQAEVDRILVHGLEQKGLSDSDRMYLTRMVADRSGLSQADAQKSLRRVR